MIPIFSALPWGFVVFLYAISKALILGPPEVDVIVGSQPHQATPNNSLQRTHQSVTLFASQKLRLFAGPLSSGR